MRLFLRWCVDRFDVSTNWLVYLLMASYAVGLLFGWIDPELIKKHVWEFATLTFLLALACYASYTVKVNKLLKQVENVERTVSRTADTFFGDYKTLENVLTEKLAFASEVVVCATFPIFFLRDRKSQLEKLLSANGRLVLILQRPNGPAHEMAINRATPHENQTRTRHAGELKTLVQALMQHSIDNGGEFSLKGTDYWPSCVITFVRSGQNLSREDFSIFLTINDYGQADRLRPSFVGTQSKEPITYNAFREDLRNIEEHSTSLKPTDIPDKYE